MGIKVFLLFLLDEIRIRSRIQEAQKHIYKSRSGSTIQLPCVTTLGELRTLPWCPCSTPTRPRCPPSCVAYHRSIRYHQHLRIIAHFSISYNLFCWDSRFLCRVCVIPVLTKFLVETLVQYFIGDALNLSLDKCIIYGGLGIAILIQKI